MAYSCKNPSGILPSLFFQNTSVLYLYETDNHHGLQEDLRRPKHEVQTCFSIAVSTNKLYGTPRSPASTVIYAGAWAVFERLTKQVVNKRDEMVVATPPSRNRYQPGGPAARCFPPRAAPSYLARSVWIYKIWLRVSGKFLTFISFRSPTT